jgi:hypothetical protein
MIDWTHGPPPPPRERGTIDVELRRREKPMKSETKRRPLKAWEKERRRDRLSHVLHLGAMTIHVVYSHKRRWFWETFQNGHDSEDGYKTPEDAKIAAEDFIREVLEDTLETLDGETED